MKKSLLAMTFIIVVLLSSMHLRANSTSLPPNGLVGYWTLDEGSGTIAYDSSGNGNNGTLYGSAWVDGKFGKALRFDGVNDYVRVEDSNSLSFSTAVTLMAWVYLPAGATYSDDRILGKDASIGGTNLHLVIRDNLGHVGFGLGVGGGYTAVVQTSTNIVPRESWTHIAATYDGSLMKIYLNGFLDSSLSWTSGFSSNDNPLTIGAKNPPYLEDFINATIDEVRIYNMTESQADIQIDMSGPKSLIINAGSGGITDPASGSHMYHARFSVTVNATPQNGYTFDHWILNGSTRTENPITITMNASYSLTALFKPNEPGEISFWMQWWLWAIIIIGIMAILLAFTTSRYRKKALTQKKPTTAITKQSPKDYKVCPNCGARLPLDSEFCGKCGTHL